MAPAACPGESSGAERVTPGGLPHGGMGRQVYRGGEQFSLRLYFFFDVCGKWCIFKGEKVCGGVYFMSVMGRVDVIREWEGKRKKKKKKRKGEVCLGADVDVGVSSDGSVVGSGSGVFGGEGLSKGLPDIGDKELLGGVEGVVGVGGDIDVLHKLYGSLDGEVGKALCVSGGSGEESGVSGAVDERAELMLLRSFAVRLFRGIGAKFERGEFVSWLKRERGMSESEALGVWDGVSGYGDVVGGYIGWCFPDSKVVSVLLRLFGEIRSLTKQIVERELRYRKMVSHEAVGEFMVELQREVEGRMVGGGFGEEQVKSFRLWYSDYCGNFVAKNVRRG